MPPCAPPGSIVYLLPPAFRGEGRAEATVATCDMVRKIALALPGAEETDHFGRPSFRVAGKIFATLWPKEKRAVLKLPADHQVMLCEADPAAFSPARWGKLVWTFVELPRVDRGQLEGLVAIAWREVAPKKRSTLR
jgi:hypothetical protein